MNDRDKSTLECPEKMCDYCCNFDKEHIGMDGMALCKLTMTLAYAEDYGGNCMFYNVPKEQIIVPPCKVGDKVYQIIDMSHTACKSFVSDFAETVEPYSIIYKNIMGGYSVIPFEQFGKTVFLTKEEAEEKLKELQNAETKKP